MSNETIARKINERMQYDLSAIRASGRDVPAVLKGRVEAYQFAMQELGFIGKTFDVVSIETVNAQQELADRKQADRNAAKKVWEIMRDRKSVWTKGNNQVLSRKITIEQFRDILSKGVDGDTTPIVEGEWNGQHWHDFEKFYVRNYRHTCVEAKNINPAGNLTA